MSPYQERYHRAIIVHEAGGAGWAKAQMAEITRALQFIGIQTVLLDVEAALAAVKALPPDSFFVVDGNNRLAEAHTARRFSVMVDHPCSLLKRVRGDELRSTIFGWVDESHIDAIAAIGLETHSVFLPHAGPDPTPQPLPMQDRDIDVFFAGTLSEPIDRSAWLAQRPDMPPVLLKAIFETVETAETTLQPILDIFTAICARHEIDTASFSRAAFCMVIGHILGIAENNRRNAILEALPDLKVLVVSEYLPARLRDRPNVRHLPYTDDFDALRRLMGRSKLVLNTTCKFPAGSHERIWYGMAEGAAILTDASLFMQRAFREGDSIFYLPPSTGAAIADLSYLMALVNDPAKLDAVVQNARATYAQQHTWKHRILWLIDALRRETCFGATPSAIAASGR
jgi:Glycosyl transferases group 1